jgi:zinc D-Ala-D-Ala carboxypeptidase
MTIEQAKAYRLSTNFTLWELINSKEAQRLGLMEQQLAITPEQIKNLETLCKHLLQPIRDYLKMPITINSGYRSKALNDAVKGSKTSDHMQGKAADIVCANIDSVWELLNFMNFKQALRYSTFIHLSYDKKDNRKDKRLWS